MLEFKIYERTETVLESLGTVLSVVGAKGKIAAIRSNLASNKRVVLILTKEDGTSSSVTCSTAVSAGLRDKSISLSQIMNFEILVGETEVPYISMPASAGLLTYEVKDLTPQDYAVPTVSSLEALAI